MFYIDQSRLIFEEFEEFFRACILTGNADQCGRDSNALSELMTKAGEVWDNFTAHSQGEAFTLRCFQELLTDTCRGPAILARPSLLANFGVPQHLWGRFLFEIAFHPRVSEFLEFVFRLLLGSSASKREGGPDTLDDNSLRTLIRAMRAGGDEEELQEGYEELKGKLMMVCKGEDSGMRDEGEERLSVSMSEWLLYFLHESLGDPSGLRNALRDLCSPSLLPS